MEEKAALQRHPGSCLPADFSYGFEIILALNLGHPPLPGDSLTAEGFGVSLGPMVCQEEVVPLWGSGSLEEDPLIRTSDQCSSKPENTRRPERNSLKPRVSDLVICCSFLLV